MAAVVIDTNVLIVANNKASHVGPTCVLDCINFLEVSRKKHVVSVDSSNLIFKEYFLHAHRSGQPGTGDAFAKWLWERQGSEDYCELVPIAVNATGNCKEFPKDPALAKFDLSDRKFVAVALKSKNNPTIINATDSDWLIFKSPLNANNVKITHVCPIVVKSSKL